MLFHQATLIKQKMSRPTYIATYIAFLASKLYIISQVNLVLQSIDQSIQTEYPLGPMTPTSAGLLALATGGSSTSIRYASASRDATRDDDGSTVTGAAGRTAASAR